MGRSFLDVVDHACTMEDLHLEASGGSDKRTRFQDSYSGSQSCDRGFQTELSVLSSLRDNLTIQFRPHFILQAMDTIEDPSVFHLDRGLIVIVLIVVRFSTMSKIPQAQGCGTSE